MVANENLVLEDLDAQIHDKPNLYGEKKRDHMKLIFDFDIYTLLDDYYVFHSMLSSFQDLIEKEPLLRSLKQSVPTLAQFQQKLKTDLLFHSHSNKILMKITNTTTQNPAAKE